MSKYEEVKTALKEEESLSPSKRKTVVPCAFCERGGNGDKSCACGFNEKRYSKFKGCFSGTILPNQPK